jgi:hypothetical protein
VSEVNETTHIHHLNISFSLLVFLFPSLLLSSPLLPLPRNYSYGYYYPVTSYTPYSRILTIPPIPSLPDSFPLFPFHVALPVRCPDFRLAFLLPHTPLIPLVAYVEWSLLAFLASSFASLPVALDTTTSPTLTRRP